VQQQQQQQQKGLLVAVDPDCRAIALHLHQGQLKVSRGSSSVLQQQQQQQMHLYLYDLGQAFCRMYQFYVDFKSSSNNRAAGWKWLQLQGYCTAPIYIEPGTSDRLWGSLCD
jgi:hypothetical protein